MGGGRSWPLALLALTPGSVPAEQLAEALWGETPPPTWRPALRGIIRGLRDALRPIGLGGEELITTVPGGYALTVALTSTSRSLRGRGGAQRQRCSPVSSRRLRRASRPAAG